jgi:hypothetical protein
MRKMKEYIVYYYYNNNRVEKYFVSAFRGKLIFSVKQKERKKMESFI